MPYYGNLHGQNRKADLPGIVQALSVQCRRFLADFDTSCDAQEAMQFCRTHPDWVGSEDDLWPSGLAVRKFLIAHPEAINS